MIDSTNNPTQKKCFIISPIGNLDTPESERNDQVRDYIIKEAMGTLGYQAIRADEIDEAGSITSQIMQHIFEDDLVVADLTDRNPNVFYELAVRHATRKPFVQIIKENQTIPFDVQGMRLIFYDLGNPASVHKAKTEIVGQVNSWEADSQPDVQTPISLPLDFLRISQRRDADSSGVLDILPLIERISSSTQEAREEIQQVSRRVATSGTARPPIAIVHSRVSRAMGSDNPFAFIVFISVFEGRAPWLYELAREAYRQALLGNFGYCRRDFSIYAGSNWKYGRAVNWKRPFLW